MTELIPISVDLFVDNAWTDVTADVQTRDEGITIGRGRSGNQGSVGPSSCELFLRGGTSKIAPTVVGRYSTKNPLSDLYGKIGRNTPIRVRVATEPGLLLDGTANSDATTPDAAALDITGDIDLRAEFTLESSAGTACLISKGPVGGPQLSYQLLIGFTAGVPHLTLRWSADGSTSLFVDHDMSEIVLGRRLAVRATLDVNNGAGGRTVTFYIASNIDGPWVQHGDATITAGTTSIFSGTAAAYVGQQGALDRFDGAIYAVRILTGIDGTAVANPNFDTQALGATSFADSAGRIWTLGANADIALTPSARFTGEVASWPIEWDTSGNDVWVPVRAAGVLRRIGQGSPASTSAVRAYLDSTTPDVYLPLDLAAGYESLDVSVRSSIFPGQGDLGSDLLPGLRVNTTSGGYLYKGLNQPTAPTEFTIDWLYKAAELGSLHLTIWLESGGIWDRFQVQLRGNDIDDDVAVVIERDYYNDGAISQVNSGALDAITDGELHHVRFHLEQDGTGVDYTVYIDGVSVLSNTAALLTLSPARFMSIDYTPTTTNYVALGHIVAWYDNAPVVADAAESVLFSLAGEAAGRRMERLADEGDMPLRFIGDIDDTALVGPQGIKPIMSLIEAAADVDLGILYEPRDELTLEYRTRTSLYNQAAGITLDYTGGVFAQPPTVIDDDQLTRNRVTVTRDGGGSVQAELTSGPLSTQAPPNGVGVYDEEVTLNVATDGQLADQAAWRLHLGTIDEARFPKLALRLHHPVFTGDAALRTAAVALEIGGRVVITDLPAWLPPDDVSLLAQGFTERLTNMTWDIEINCVPESPYDLAVYGSAAGSGPDRYDTAGSELAAAINSSAVTLSVRSDDTLWTTNAAEFPFDIVVGGERMTVTDIDGGHPSFVAAGTSTSSAGGVGVTLAGPGLPGGTQVGDVVLILASIRNTAGLAQTPAGWTEWSHPVGTNFNVRMFGRVYDGVWTMPATITYTGGAANATLLAQSAAFRNVTLVDSLTSAQVNASAQNIDQAWATVNPDRRWGVGIAQGWKQDDWTSVADLPGWTEIGELASTLGDDAGQVWDYLVTRLATVPANASDDFTVTGGAAAVSQSNLTFLPRVSQTFTVTRSVNGISKSHAAGAAVRLWTTPRYGL